MDPQWLEDFSTINFASESDRQELSDDDFRRTGPLIIKTVALVCDFAKSWTKETTIFFEKNRMVSGAALSRKLWMSFVSIEFSASPKRSSPWEAAMYRISFESV